MADTINKPKLQLRSGVSVNGDKTPSPATKLLISHGKPNFTIQRSPKIEENGRESPLQTQNNNYNAYKSANNNDFVVKSTKFNGVFNTANIQVSEKQSHQQGSTENEAAKVVLRRIKVPELPAQENEDASVPEFIRRQRRIQERLAKENLDFENRRSGYFTQVMISPTSTNRTSFVETMSSPAIVPALEIPPPAPQTVEEEKHEEVEAAHMNGFSNGHAERVEVEEEEEVAKAIEEVNKAVAGEEEDKLEPETVAVTVEPVVAVEPMVAAVTSATLVEEPVVAVEEEKSEQAPVVAAVATLVQTEEPVIIAEVPAAAPEEAVVTSLVQTEEPVIIAEVPTAAPEATIVEEVAHAVVAVVTLEAEKSVEEEKHITVVPAVEAVATLEHVEVKEKPVENGHAEQEHSQQNGHVEVNIIETNGDATKDVADGITISHTNGFAGPCVPSPDPSGALGVNYEPKTVVSFSQEMGSDVNKYPDTVKVMKEGATVVDEELKELSKLKFEIKTDDEDVVQVTPVLRAE